MDFSTVIAKVHNIHERVTEDCIAAAHFAKDNKGSKALLNSVKELERFVVIPHMGGYTADHLLRVLFLTEGHLSRHFKDSKGYGKDLKEIDRLRTIIRGLINDTE